MKSFRTLVWQTWQADLDAWEREGWPFGRKPHQLLLALFHYHGVRATLLHRLAFWAYESRLPLVPSALSQLNILLHSFECPPSVPIGPGLYMPHTVGTVVTAERIGANVTLQSGVTVGQRRGVDFPTIEDGVVLATGARVLGAIVVGAGSTVGANSVVLEDVPAGATVVGVPARVISQTPVHAHANGETAAMPEQHVVGLER